MLKEHGRRDFDIGVMELLEQSCSFFLLRLLCEGCDVDMLIMVKELLELSLSFLSVSVIRILGFSSSSSTSSSSSCGVMLCFVFSEPLMTVSLILEHGDFRQLLLLLLLLVLACFFDTLPFTEDTLSGVSPLG